MNPLKSIFVNVAEKTINHYINLDPDTAQAFAALSGKAIEVHLTRQEWYFYLEPQSTHVQFTLTRPDTVHLRLSAPLQNFLYMIKAHPQKFQKDHRMEHPIHIEGDLQLAQKLQRIFQAMDIDWEAHLARYSGDIAAHQIMKGVNHFAKFTRHCGEKIGNNVREYLHYDSGTLVSPQECQLLFDDISALSDDVERAEARLHHLLKAHLHE